MFPFRYVASIMETFILYRQFAKPPEVRAPKQDTLDFWMELLLQACKPTNSTARCPVSNADNHNSNANDRDVRRLCLLLILKETKKMIIRNISGDSQQNSITAFPQKVEVVPCKIPINWLQSAHRAYFISAEAMRFQNVEHLFGSIWDLGSSRDLDYTR